MTIAAVAIGATLVSGVISAMGAMQAADAQASAYERDAAISERNKVIADQDRQQAVATANIAAQDKRRSNRRQLAAMRAAYGSTGFDMSGSPLDILADTSTEMALDERRIEYEGTVRNREGALQMLYLQEDADGSRMAAKNTRKAGRITALSTLAGSAGSAANMASSART
jgi:hypothetical protein